MNYACIYLDHYFAPKQFLQNLTTYFKIVYVLADYGNKREM